MTSITRERGPLDNPWLEVMEYRDTPFTSAWKSLAAIPLSVIANLPILCFSGQHVSELHMFYFYFFQFAPARFLRTVLLFFSIERSSPRNYHAFEIIIWKAQGVPR